MRLCELPFERRALPNLLREQAAAIPDAIWVRSDEDRFSFGTADRVVDTYARGLAALGVGPGSLVAVMMENSPEMIWAIMAITRLGAIFVAVNAALKAGFLRHVLNHSGATAIILDGHLGPRLAAVLAETPLLRLAIVAGDGAPIAHLRTLSLSELRVSGDGPVECPARGDDLMAILYTSGTTGASKGVAMSHNYWYEAVMSLHERRDIRDGDVFYVSSPMFHAAALLQQVFTPLALGLSLAVDRRFSVSGFWDRLRHYRATQIFTMSAQHLWLWNAPPRADDADNPARVWGAVPLAAELHEPFKRRFGIEHLWNTYGQTEAMVVASTDVRRPHKAGSSGWARPEVELAVVDDLDRPVLAGAVGELVVRPRTPYTLMSGYWRDSEATVAADRNLWYHTGDLARIDTDGEVFFLDRKADYLRVHGENISSFEVEAAVVEHPEIAEAAVVGVPSGPGDTEEELMVYVILKPPSRLDALGVFRHCLESLPRFAVPRFIEVVDELPRTPTDRVRKAELRRRGVSSATWDRIAAGHEILR